MKGALMGNDISELKTYASKIRADLMASNLVMSAIVGTMPPEQHQAVLRAIAQLSVMQEQTAEKAQMPPEALQPVLESINRLHDHLQGLYKLRRDA